MQNKTELNIMSINCEFIDDIVEVKSRSLVRNYELECSDVIYNCIIMVMIPDMSVAKRVILENIANTNLDYDIPDFKPYKSRLHLNIPLLQQNIRHHLYSLLNQFYDVIIINGLRTYVIQPDSTATHEDIDELVGKMCDILSNKFLGKDIVKKFEKVEMANQFDLYF